MDDRLADEARTYTERQCPQMLDAGSRLDSLTYDRASRTLTRWITLYGVLDNEETLRQMKNDGPRLRGVLLAQTETNTDLQQSRRYGVNFRFVYRSASHPAFRQEFILTPNDYRREN